MRSIETSGKTVEDAVKAGLAELKCDSADVAIDVLEMGSPGLFGMFGKLARVRLTVKEVVDDFAFDLPVMTLDTAQKPRAEKKPPEKKPEKPVAGAQGRKKRTSPNPKPVKPPRWKPRSRRRRRRAEGQAPVIKSVAEFKASRQRRAERTADPVSSGRQPREPRDAPRDQQPREPREPMQPREAGAPREPREPMQPRENPANTGNRAAGRNPNAQGGHGPR